MKEQLLKTAMETKLLYNCGAITRAEAKKRIEPYEDYFNEQAAIIAKKYNRKAMKFSFISFMR